MSMHFVPQWVKPIKPAGSSALNTSSGADVVSPLNKPVASQPGPASAAATSAQPFPALGAGGGRASPTTATAPNPALSYSRATHAPQSPTYPDASYFPPQGEDGSANPHPFRYSREQILGLYDEDKVREVPIDLAALLEQGGVLVSKQAVKPVGLRDLSEVEKKLFATSIHPPLPTRRIPNQTQGEQTANGTPGRRGLGTLSSKDPQANGRAFGGFGRGEGGAFGTGKIGTIGGGAGVGAPGEGRAPGAMGGGFGGVGKRLSTRRTESSDATQDAPRSAGSTWRPTRTTSGNFEGVLGFGGQQAQAGSVPAPAEEPVANGKEEKEPVAYGNGGGPGWGSGQKKWRLAATQQGDEDKILEVPNASQVPLAESVVATASATPLPERDATVREVVPPVTQLALVEQAVEQPQVQSQSEQAPPVQEKEDLGAVEWYYRDPAGLEQGPFIATQMHDWYTHSYFQDDLPLRRSSETGFHTLGELKTATGSQVQPFLAAVRPRLPPNLPIPAHALGSNPVSPAQAPGSGPAAPAFPVDNFRNMAISSPAVAPQQVGSGGFGYGGPFSPAAAFGGVPGGPGGMQSPGFGSPAHVHPQSWGQSPMTPGAHAHLRATDSPLRSPFGPVPGEGFGGMYAGFGAAPGAGVPGSNGLAQGPGQAFGQGYWPGQGPAYRPPQPQFDQISQPQPQQQQYHAPIGSDPFQQPQNTSEQPQQYHQEEEVPVPVTVQDMSVPEEELKVSSPAQPVQEVEDEEEQGVEEAQQEASHVPDAAPAPPASVWGQVPKAPSHPPSRKVSVSAPTPAVAASLPAAPASLPAKPIAAETPAPAKAAPTPAAQAVAEERSASPPAATTPSAPKAAPWAVKEDKASAQALSLRQIQEAEARQAEARRAALAEARAAASISFASSDNVELPSSMAWGLASSGAGSGKTGSAAQSPAVSTPPAAWGSGDAAPKKTLKQIQEEEEKRKRALQAAALARQAAAAPAGASASAASAANATAKRGYADLAAAPAAAPLPGWSTVGSGGRAVPGAAPKAAASAPVTSAPKPTLSSIIKPSASPAPSSLGGQTSAAHMRGAALDEAYTPSLDFIKWAKAALSGLRTPVDEFLQICLSFPVDPPQGAKGEAMEIISDTVYANSATLDGRRFASEFFERRKADAKARRAGGGAGVGGDASVVYGAGAGGVGAVGAGAGGWGAGGSLADVVKSVPTPKGGSADAGFKVVKGKGKKK